MNFPKNLKYTKDHEWIMIDGDTATIGITEFAQRELGDIEYVEIETVGKTLEAEAVFGTVEAVKTVSDLFLPGAGTITEVNPALAATPELVNSDPYGEGWMVKMKVKNAADIQELMDADAYAAVAGE
jgi:glycine cleavage system H protein